MIASKLKKTVIITGASASGKTTLYRRMLVHFLFDPTPVHMTRRLRFGEVENVDAVFISEKKYKENFSKNLYLQEKIEDGYFNGTYSGCPKKWVSDTNMGRFSCVICPTEKMAKSLKETLGSKVLWVHLVASQSDRRCRLIKRSFGHIKEEDLTEKVRHGSRDVDIDGHDFLVDTSILNKWDVFFTVAVKC